METIEDRPLGRARTPLLIGAGAVVAAAAILGGGFAANAAGATSPAAATVDVDEELADGAICDDAPDEGDPSGS